MRLPYSLVKDCTNVWTIIQCGMASYFGLACMRCLHCTCMQLCVHICLLNVALYAECLFLACVESVPLPYNIPYITTQLICCPTFVFCSLRFYLLSPSVCSSVEVHCSTVDQHLKKQDKSQIDQHLKKQDRSQICFKTPVNNCSDVRPPRLSIVSIGHFYAFCSPGVCSDYTSEKVRNQIKVKKIPDFEV